MSLPPAKILPFNETADALARLVPGYLKRPRVAIVCGSGLSTLVSTLKDVCEVPYSVIPGFGNSTVSGQKSILAFGLMGKDNVPVVAMLGRFHPYEGYDLSMVTYPIRVMALMGANKIIITNAAGSLNPEIPVGTIVVVHDHLAIPNLTGMNASFGPMLSPGYPRFLPLSDAYSVPLRRLAFLASHDLKFERSALAEGTYAWVSGPTYETPAEGRFLRNAGADIVGMSTIPEVVAARQEGMEVLVLSLVTNAVVIPDKYRSIREEVEAELAGHPIESPSMGIASHEEVLEMGRRKADVMKSLVERIVELVSTGA